MNKFNNIRTLAVVAAVGSVLLSLTGCPSTPVNPPPPPTPTTSPSPGPTPVAFACPPLPATMRVGCPDPGADLTAMTLTCNGSPTFTTGPISSSGGTRISVTIPSGSTITTTVFPLAPLTCDRLPSNTITITLGVTYVGDLGPGTPLCISQSKATFSQFMSSDPLVAILEGPLKGEIHLSIDRAVIGTLSGAPPSTPRCSSWRQMP